MQRTAVTLAALVAATVLVGSAASGTQTVTPPTISSFSPLKGAVGRLVTITGTALKGTSAVRFGKAYSMFTVVSGTEIQANVPPGALTGVIKVTKGMQTASSADVFTVLPKITSFSPGSGAVGTLVTIHGTTFNGTTAVYFGSVAADLSSAVIQKGTIKVNVPVGATTGKIFVTTPAGTAHSPTAFTVS
jgi:hypothetical protein